MIMLTIYSVFPKFNALCNIIDVSSFLNASHFPCPKAQMISLNQEK